MELRAASRRPQAGGPSWLHQGLIQELHSPLQCAGLPSRTSRTPHRNLAVAAAAPPCTPPPVAAQCAQGASSHLEAAPDGLVVVGAEEPVVGPGVVGRVQPVLRLIGQRDAGREAQARPSQRPHLPPAPAALLGLLRGGQEQRGSKSGRVEGPAALATIPQAQQRQWAI